MSLFGIVGNVFGPKYGNAVIKESLEPIPFNGTDTISLDITGEGLLFLNPSKEGDAEAVAKTILVCAGATVAQYKMTSHDAVIESDSWTHQSTCTLHGIIDPPSFSVGYEGPLFAQVTGPGHISSKVQVGIMVPQTEYGVPIIRESIEGISFNGKDQIRLNINGDWLTFQDPMEKTGWGGPRTTVKTISVTGTEGSGEWKYENHGYASACGDTTAHGIVDPECHAGYEGPLFAQVTGPGPASSKVQVGILMTEKDYHTYVAKKDREKLIQELTDQFNQLDANKDGFLTRAGIEEAAGGPEMFAQIKAMYLDMQKRYEAGDPNVHQVGGPVVLKFMEVVFKLDGDDRASLADLLRACELGSVESAGYVA